MRMRMRIEIPRRDGYLVFHLPLRRRKYVLFELDLFKVGEGKNQYPAPLDSFLCAVLIVARNHFRIRMLRYVCQGISIIMSSFLSLERCLSQETVTSRRKKKLLSGDRSSFTMSAAAKYGFAFFLSVNAFIPFKGRRWNFSGLS